MIDILTQIVVTLVAWFALMLVCTNLVGFAVRGLFTNPEVDKLAAEGNDILAEEHQRTERNTNFVAFSLLTMLLVALYYFWNIGLAISALILMAARVPDLIWEIKHQRQLRMKDMKRPPLYVLSTILSWTSFPVIWYALYRM
jgi:hypothetical protein